MEALTEGDVDMLTSHENMLIFLRKREAANKNSAYLLEYISEAIVKCHCVRQILQGRFDLPIDKDI